jgi:hypothetical protein
MGLAQYDAKYYAKYLPTISSSENAFATLNTVLSKLPLGVQARFKKRFLAITLQHPNNEDCSLPANPAGVRKFEKPRSDGRNVILFLCAEHILFTTESIATLWLVIMSLEKLEEEKIDRITEATLRKNSEAAVFLFNFYRKGGSAYLCGPAFRAYVFRREEEEINCWGKDPNAVAAYMAPLISIPLKEFMPELATPHIGDIDLYFGLSDAMVTAISKALVIFTLLHEIAHVINGDLDREPSTTSSEEITADQFALNYIGSYMDEGEKAVAVLSIVLAHFHISSVNFSWLRSEEGLNKTELDKRVLSAQLATNCTIGLLVEDASLPSRLKVYLTDLLKQPQYRCKRSP